MAIARVEPTGCQEWHGLVKVRFDLFLEKTDARYNDRYILVPVIPESGYPGEVDANGDPVDQADYDAWIASLPHIYQLNPFHTHFLRFEPDVSQDEVLEAISHHIPNFYAAWLQEWDKIPGGMRKGWDIETRKRPRRYDREMTLAKYQIRKQACFDKVSLIKASHLSSRNQDTGEVFPSTEIDIGAAATDRASTWIGGYTLISKENPANSTGTIDEIEIFAVSGKNMTDCEVATFEEVDTDTFTTRDSETIGAVTGGSKQTFSALDMDVSSVDYLGTYFGGGVNSRIERDESGDGIWYVSGTDYIPCTSQAFTFGPNATISLYGTGETAVVAGIGAYSQTLNPWGINKYGARIG